MFSLLSYGEVLVDFLPINGLANQNEAVSYHPLAGGAPANVAVAYAKLGANSYFAGGISEDNFGAMLMQQLVQENVNTALVQRIKNSNTAVVLVSLDESGERSFNFYRHDSADTQYDSTQVDEAYWQDIGVFHFCSNTLTSDAMYLDTLYAIKRAKENNTVISFDVNLRQQLWPDLSLLPTRVTACLEKSDIIKFSKDEAQYLANAMQLGLAAYYHFVLTLGAKLMVITDGANTIQVMTNNNCLMIDVPSITPVDTTAAGDSFIAGLLFYFNQQANAKSLLKLIEQEGLIANAVAFAASCGAFTCQKKGAFTALPKLTDLSG
ncbi:MAG: carbohydrate kinase family protein [Thalassotalea sp.]